MSEGRKPDLVLKALNRNTGDRTARIGAGWINEDASITVRLDDFVVLPAGGPAWIFTLFPTSRSYEVKGEKER